MSDEGRAIAVSAMRELGPVTCAKASAFLKRAAEIIREAMDEHPAGGERWLEMRDISENLETAAGDAAEAVDPEVA